ncbi:MAG: glycosyl hydrolase family 18 protein, partial [Cytophagaceae bacterium]
HIHDRFMYIATHEGRLNSFCNNILNFIKTNNLDGWDLDWEYPRTAVERNAHEHMLKTMRTKIDSMKIADCKPYEISIAVGGA